MARIHRYCREIAAAFAVSAALFLAPAFAEDQAPNAGTDLYDRPVLAVDPGRHTALIFGQAVDREGKYAVTGSADRTVRIWSVADGKLLRTISIPVGPDLVGDIYGVAISPDIGGCWGRPVGPSNPNGDHPIYLFDRESGDLIHRIHGDLPGTIKYLTFSPRRPLPRGNAWSRQRHSNFRPGQGLDRSLPRRPLRRTKSYGAVVSLTAISRPRPMTE